MKEIFYASSEREDLGDHAFESYEDCVEFAKEVLTRKIGYDTIEDNEEGWLDEQYSVHSMTFHYKGQY